MTLADQASTTTDRGLGLPDFGGTATYGQPEHGHMLRPNVNGSERAVSVAAGAIAGLLGLSRGGLPGALIAAVGGAMIFRGATGYCPLYAAMDIDTTQDHASPEDMGTSVRQSFSINKSADELYAYWRNFENLPRIMNYLESVRVLDDRRSHWVAKAPGIAGGTVEWDAEITSDQPGSMIAWRSLPGADVENSGSVTFVTMPGDRGTAIRVVMDYVPPAGRVGKWVATLFGKNPDSLVREDLRNFKRVMELGEAPTIDGQPRGTCTGQGTRDSA